MNDFLWEKIQKFDTFFKSSCTGIFTINLHSRFIEANQYMNILTGYSNDELFRISLESLFYLPNEIIRIHKIIDELILQRTQNKPGEYILKKKDGSITWVLLECIPLYIEGKLHAILGTITDILICKEIDPDSTHQKNFIQKVFDTHPGMVYLFDLYERRALYINRTAAAVLGYTSGDIIGKGDHVLPELVHPDDLQMITNHFESLKNLPEKEIREVEFRVKDSVGGWRWMLSHHTAFLRNSDGSVHGVLGSVNEITERKEWEEALSKKEEYLRITLESIGDGVVVTDLKGNIIRMNKTAQKLTGWKIEEARDKPFSDIIKIVRSEDGIPINSFVMNVLYTGKKMELSDNLILFARDNTQYYITDSIAPIKDSEDRIRGLVLVFSDVTERYRLQQKVLQNEERLKLAIESAELGTIDWDIITGKIKINQRWARMLGYSPEEIEKDKFAWDSLIYPDDKPGIEAKLREHLEGKSALFEAEHRMITKTGGLVWVLSKGKVIDRNSEEKPIRFSGTQMEITARKQTELSLKFNTERYRTYLKETTDGIYRAEIGSPIDISLSAEKQIDLFYERVYLDECNDAFAHMYGYENGDDMKGIKLFELHGGKNNPQNVAFLTQFVKNKYRIENAISMEFDRYHQVRYFSNNIFGIIQDGKILRAWGTQRDITDLKRAEDAERRNAEELTKANKMLQKANESLKSLDTLKTDFVSMASHELRTPITAVLGFTQTLLAPDITLTHEEQTEYLGIIEKEALRLGKLIDDLLDISKIESRRYEFKKESVSLSNMAQDIVNTMEIPSDKKIIIESDTFGKKPLLCDKDKIRRVFINIIGNALRYGNRIDIRISGNESERTIVISDNGPGIEPQYFSKIFEKFYRIPKGGASGEGSGLGLAISKDIIEAHNGKIWVESDGKKGTAFHFIIRSL